MGRQLLGYVLVAIGIGWLFVYGLITDTDAEGNRVDMFGLEYPRGVMGGRHAKYSMARFKYPHFYISVGGFVIPFVIGMVLIKGGRSEWD